MRALIEAGVVIFMWGAFLGSVYAFAWVMVKLAQATQPW